MDILFIIVGIVIGSLGLYFVLRPKLQATTKIETDIEEQNKELRLKNQELNKKYNSLSQDLNGLTIELQALEDKKQILSSSIKEL